MELEERTIESLPQSCESCGTELTVAEKERILEEGAEVALCDACAAEEEPPDLPPIASDDAPY
jgi:hypothetical protein